MVELSKVFGLSSTHIQFEGNDVPLHEEVVPHYRSLVKVAEKRGFGLCAASGFRDFERQAHIWNAKLSGQRAVLGDNGESVEIEKLSQKELVFAVLRWSALPGASRHHWGTDFDIYDKKALAGTALELTVEETNVSGPFYKMYCWLEEYLESSDLGFCRPYLKDKGGVAREPWHLSYHPIAKEFEAVLNPGSLADFVAQSDLLLKECVIRHFDEIYDRFILNRGTIWSEGN